MFHHCGSGLSRWGGAFCFPLLAGGVIAVATAQGLPVTKFNPIASNATESEARSSGAPVQGVSANDIIQRALASNAELAAARLEIDRARARKRQAGLRPNPTLDVEQSSGHPVGTPGERATSIGVSLPLELGGQRRRRLDLGQAELEAAEAAVADRERRLAQEVRAALVDALAAQRELEIIEGINRLDTQTVRVVEARVTEGESAPLEANLLRAEIDRVRARRALANGRWQAALLRLKTLAGMPFDEPLQMRADAAQFIALAPPQTIEAAIEVALRTRPDLRLARLTEEAARAGLRLAEAQAFPQVAVTARYTTDRTITTLPAPLLPTPDTSRALIVGVSVGLPFFNRNQGGRADAALAITQAEHRREFITATVRAEVASAFTRARAAAEALVALEQGAITRTRENIRAIRGAYEVGAYRITELLGEQRRLLDAERELTETLAERWRALADLQAAMGGSND